MGLVIKMSYPKNLIGIKFNRLTVIDKAERPKNYKDRHSFWLCECECGNSITISRNRLVTGHTKSCGCLKLEHAEYMGSKNKKHGLRTSRIYEVWKNMSRRCNNPEDSAYVYYGERGISICDEWSGEIGLLNFYNWALANGYRDDLTIDRINSNGNYEPSNCRWTDMGTQNRNKNNNIKIIINGVSFDSLKDVAKHYGVSYNTVYGRHKRGLKGFDLVVDKH